MMRYWDRDFTRWDRFCRWLAFKLPRKLVYHAYIRLHGYATSGNSPWARKHPDECPWSEAVKVWEGRS